MKRFSTRAIATTAILLSSALPTEASAKESTPDTLPTAPTSLGTVSVSEPVNAAHTHPNPRPNDPTPRTDEPSARAVSAQKAYEDLLAGNKRFVAGKMSHRNSDETRRREIAAGQKPRAVLLSCSDSRTAPEIVFDQGLGDLFPVRVAGNILGAAEVASIEYAIEHLGTNLIVIMGHESCDAVKTALSAPKNGSVGSYDLDSLVSSIQQNMGDAYRGKPGRAIASEDKKLRKPVMANVDAVAEGLIKRSKIVAKYVGEGTVQIVRGIYSLETGKVDFWANEWAASK